MNQVKIENNREIDGDKIFKECFLEAWLEQELAKVCQKGAEERKEKEKQQKKKRKASSCDNVEREAPSKKCKKYFSTLNW